MALGNPITLTDNVAAKVISVTATSGQTVFTVTGGYRINQLGVYRNGVRLVESNDYTASDGASVTLYSEATLDDILAFQIFDDFRVSDAIVSSASTQTISGNLNVTGAYYGNGANLTGIDTTSLKDSGGVVRVQANTSGTVVSGMITATTGDYSGNVTIGGTLTYEDVTNIDSVGIITARTGVRVTDGGVIVTAGVSTFSADIDANAGIDVDGHTELDDVNVSGASTFTGAADFNGAIDVDGHTELDDLGVAGISTFAADVSIADKIIHTGDTNTAIRFPANDTFTVETSGSERLRITSNAGLLLSNGILVEHCKIVSTAWSTTNDISLDDGNVFLNTANLAGTNNTIDITSSNGLNVDLAVGDMTSVTLITAVNATTAFIDHITIAASAVTESWVGGSAPTDGGGSGYDVYTFTIIKTAANTYVCIANQVKGS